MIQIKSFLSAQGKGMSLLFALLLGWFVPQAHVHSFLIQYLLMVMLFFAFLDIEFKLQGFQNSVIWALIVNVAIAFFGYVVLSQFNLILALADFMTDFAPTAIAAPVIIGFIKREVEFVVASVLLTNLASALVIPLALLTLFGKGVQISI
jgi:hypothetical protein